MAPGARGKRPRGYFRLSPLTAMTTSEPMSTLPATCCWACKKPGWRLIKVPALRATGAVLGLSMRCASLLELDLDKRVLETVHVGHIVLDPDRAEVRHSGLEFGNL